MTVQKIDVMYTAVATAENGRDGRVATNDGKLDVVVNPPKEMGGSGAGTNPEQLFAAGYSACFQGALGVVARQEKTDITGSTMTAKVSIGKLEDGASVSIVEIVASHPEPSTRPPAKALLEAAHQVCPYSNATRGNIRVARSHRTGPHERGASRRERRPRRDRGPHPAGCGPRLLISSGRAEQRPAQLGEHPLGWSRNSGSVPNSTTGAPCAAFR